MACNCHGKTGVSVGRVAPYDQCTVCAKKHIVKAWNLFNEFMYTDDNRDVITGQLRLAVDHLMYEHRHTALQARDLAQIIEMNHDSEITSHWDDLLAAVRNDFYADHPDAAENLEKLKQENQDAGH